MEFYTDDNFSGIYGTEDPQYPIFLNSSTGCVISFSCCNIIWFYKLPTYIYLSKIHSNCFYIVPIIKVLISNQGYTPRVNIKIWYEGKQDLV